MLVLSRRAGQNIIFTALDDIPKGTRISLRVVEFKGLPRTDKVRLGITAPNSISVHRGEIQRIVDGEAVA